MSIAAVTSSPLPTSTVLSGKDPFIQKLYHKVIDTIQMSESVPGLKSSEEFKQIKEGVKQ